MDPVQALQVEQYGWVRAQIPDRDLNPQLAGVLS